MRIDVPHALDQAEAIRRLDRLLDHLIAREWPGGVVVSGARKAWSGPRMAFSFAAGKGGFGVSVDGTVVVGAGQVTLESELPMLVRAVIGEERVRQVVTQGLRDALNGTATPS